MKKYLIEITFPQLTAPQRYGGMYIATENTIEKLEALEGVSVNVHCEEPYKPSSRYSTIFNSIHKHLETIGFTKA